MDDKRWLGFVIGLAVTICVLVAGFNFVVDPWGLNEWVSVAGFNARKPEPLSIGRLHKAYGMARLKPPAVAMGTSTTEHGISMQHPGWRDFSAAYNFSFPAATIAEISTFLREAHRLSPIKHATIGLELFSFNAYREPNAQSGQAIDAMKSPLARARPYFTRSMLAAALDTLLRQPALFVYFLPTGQSSTEAFDQWLVKSGGHHNLFAIGSRQFVRSLLPKPALRFELQRGNEPPTLDLFRDLLEFARVEGMELQFFIAPCHAWQLETVRAMGLWPSLEYWKQQLARTVDRYAGATRVTLWDFADFSPLTTESVPPAGDSGARMRWFWDPLHYRAELGDVVQDRMFGPHASAAPAPDGYGVRLDARNVNEHLLKVRERERLYRASHPHDIAEVEALVAKELRSLRAN